MNPKSFTREQIAERIADHGDALLIYQNGVYRVNNWMKYHPGGEMIIQHMIGKDATDEINAYHSDEILKEKLPMFYIGKVAQPDSFRSLNPPIQCLNQLKDKNNNSICSKEQLLATLEHEKNEKLIKSYRELWQKLKFLGLFDCHPVDYAADCCRYMFLLFWTIYFFSHATNAYHYYLSAVFLGAFWHQLTFTAHDAGHLAITHSYKIDSYIGIFIGNLLGGISIGWWKFHHNIHHVVTNSPEHDPDIQHLPFFAITPKFMKSIYSTYHRRVLSYNRFASLMVGIQNWTYYLIMCFARVNLQIQSYIYLYKYSRAPFRRIEIAAIVAYWCWFFLLLSYIPSAIDRFIYAFICYVVTMPLHVQITLSHFGMSTEDYGPSESFPAKMLRTTMDIACPTWLDFFHGGLQYQAVHHLFPRMPRHQLRSASHFVQQYAKEVGLTYHIYGFVHGNAKVLNVLKDVAAQIKLLHHASQVAH